MNNCIGCYEDFYLYFFSVHTVSYVLHTRDVPVEIPNKKEVTNYEKRKMDT